MTTWYHGTTAKRFAVGDMVVPASAAGIYSNIGMRPGFEHERAFASGRVANMHDVVWLTADPAEAADWAYHSTLKALASEIRRMPAGGMAVYEVEPVDLDEPLEQHSATEAACATARVVREVLFEAFPQDLCDECGEPATRGLGTDCQTCEDCAATSPDNAGTSTKEER